MTNISEGRVLSGRSLKAAIKHANKAKELAVAIDLAQREQIRIALQISADLTASLVEMGNVIKDDLGMTDEEFAEWIVVYTFAPSTGVALLVKLAEEKKQADFNPKLGLN